MGVNELNNLKLGIWKLGFFGFFKFVWEWVFGFD